MSAALLEQSFEVLLSTLMYFEVLLGRELRWRRPSSSGAAERLTIDATVSRLFVDFDTVPHGSSFNIMYIIITLYTIQLNQNNLKSVPNI